MMPNCIYSTIPLDGTTAGTYSIHHSAAICIVYPERYPLDAEIRSSRESRERAG